ncbi:MAG: SsrA-binding protein SmpB [Kiritimatiellae bacterium]|nr:SsrA-binding protein SmpB [Kiritimatiellia bacterium]
MSPSPKATVRQLATNRRALHDHFVLERHEAGIELLGTEVKSIRAGGASLAGSYARPERGEIRLYNFSIPPYTHGNRFNHDPLRPKRLLLHKREIQRLQSQVEQGGRTLIPLRIYLKGGLIKVELGLCQGKRQTDKREDLRRKTAEREAQRVLRHHAH